MVRLLRRLPRGQHGSLGARITGNSALALQPAHTRNMNTPQNKQSKLRPGYWYGLLKNAVAADREVRGEPPELTEDEVLGWADAFYLATAIGRASIPADSRVPRRNLAHGVGSACAGPAGFSIWWIASASVRPPPGSIQPVRPGFLRRPDHRLGRILAAETGLWPMVQSGEIPGQGGLTWLAVDEAYDTDAAACPAAVRYSIF